MIRKLNQVKRSLETVEDMGKSERKRLERELLERRVDLNYILVRIVFQFSERQLTPT